MLAASETEGWAEETSVEDGEEDEDGGVAAGDEGEQSECDEDEDSADLFFGLQGTTVGRHSSPIHNGISHERIRFAYTRVALTPSKYAPCSAIASRSSIGPYSKGLISFRTGKCG